MMYIPTDDEIKFDYIMSTRTFDDIGPRGDAFDRWLEEHDRQLLARHNVPADWVAAYGAAVTD